MSTRRRRADHGPSLFEDVVGSPAGAFRPRIVAGLDEAGLGPMLGPLTIGMSAFEVEPGRSDLWEALDSAVAREPGRAKERVVVADSKVLFARTSEGHRRLERTVLVFDALRSPDRRVRACTRDFLESSALDDAAREELAREAWYAALPSRLSDETDEHELAGATSRLAEACATQRIAPVGLWVRAVPAAALNASFERTGNKSVTHWEACAPFLQELWLAHGSRGIDVVVDRHGGRMRYAPLLSQTLPGSSLECVREEPTVSEYFVTGAGGRALRIVFAEKAESFSFAVALASCAAKYARESCMAAFNAYFLALQPDLVPTAGYVTDARRWLADAGAAIERSGLAREAIVRSR